MGAPRTIFLIYVTLIVAGLALAVYVGASGR
jgi:hypothetical protein